MTSCLPGCHERRLSFSGMHQLIVENEYKKQALLSKTSLYEGTLLLRAEH